MTDSKCPLGEHSALVTEIDNCKSNQSKLVKNILAISGMIVIVLIAVFGVLFAKQQQLDNSIQLNKEDRREQIERVDRRLSRIEGQLEILIDGKKK